MIRTSRNVAILLVVSLIALAGCGSPEGHLAAGAAAPVTAGAAPATDTGKIALPRKIIYTGDLSLVSDNLDRAAQILDQKIHAVGGYVGNASRGGNAGEGRHGHWSIRIPSLRFDMFVKSLTAVGELQSSSIQADDVSDEFYDAQARLKNKKVEEARLLQLLQKGTARLTDILTVEREVTRVREEIERIEGRIRFLSNQTDYSTVDVSIQEIKDYAPTGSPTLGVRVSRSFTSSVETLRDFGIGILLFAAAVLPWLVPLVLLGLMVKWVVTRWLRRTASKPPKVAEGSGVDAAGPPDLPM